jgi:hypothetical protein
MSATWEGIGRFRRNHSPVPYRGVHVSTRTIAIIALIIAVVLVIVLFVI